MEDKVRTSDLENGNVLIYLKKKYYEAPSQETLLPLLSCLRDSKVYVPFVAKFSESDKKRLEKCAEGEMFVNKDKINLTADLLKGGDGKIYFPVFSQLEQMTDDYAKRFTPCCVSMDDAVKMAHGDSTVDALVLDAFTDVLVLPFELADYMLQIPTRLSEEESK